jgi:vacuolar-type H+-ATPase subunit D/Vma8
MTASVAAATTPASGSSSTDSTTDQAISQMEAAFDQAIQTNAEITSIKTLLGSIETVAQQRPNIG